MCWRRVREELENLETFCRELRDTLETPEFFSKSVSKFSKKMENSETSWRRVGDVMENIWRHVGDTIETCLHEVADTGDITVQRHYRDMLETIGRTVGD